MHRLLVIIPLVLLCGVPADAQDTFSIVAVDTVTYEIGSAGASCVGPLNGVGAYIISDVIEGVGAIHTQASWLEANQQAAHQQMLLGRAPQQIIDYLILNDAQGNPTIRQYGVVDLTRRGESAAYTGVNCTNYKNHSVGPGYSVQGNILLGQSIIDTIRNVYLQTGGPIADRLLRALEAAKIVGADTRCSSRGTSSRSSFIKVVRAGDGNTPYLLKIVSDSPTGVDPIGLLRIQFNAWKDSLRNKVDPFLSRLLIDRDTLPANGTAQAVLTIVPRNNSDTLLSSGRTILLSHTGRGVLSAVTDLGNGTYVATVTAPATAGLDTISARVVTASDTVRLWEKKRVVYRAATGVHSDRWARQAQGFALLQNYPNPFNGTTHFGLVIADCGLVSLRVYDALGREVATLVNEVKQPGRYSVRWDALGIAGGAYYYQLRAGAQVLSGRFVILK